MENIKRKSTKVAVGGIVLSGSLFILSMISLFSSVQGEWLWIAFLILSLLIGLITSFVWPVAKRNGRSFFVASGIAVLILAAILDMYYESTNTYSGGFGVGNGFMLDGIAQVIYVYALPPFFLIYVIFLVINMRKKSA